MGRARCIHNARQRCLVCAPGHRAEQLALEVAQIEKAAHIVSVICHVSHITEIQLRSHNRAQPIVVPRHIAFYLLRELTGLSLPKIGRFLHRDHSTVHNSWKLISARAKAQPAFRRLIDGYAAQTTEPPEKEVAA